MHTTKKISGGTHCHRSGHGSQQRQSKIMHWKDKAHAIGTDCQLPCLQSLHHRANLGLRYCLLQFSCHIERVARG